MDPTLVTEFTELHAKAKSGPLDAREQQRWLQLKQTLIVQVTEKPELPRTARPISKPG